MNRLIIRVKGDVESSNFEEWKSAFIAQIQSIDTELQTEDDFADAVGTVKRLQAGEKALQQAKQKALDASSGIQSLFAAIDEVADRARRTRLTLARQIKQRKQEIKDAHVQAGVERVHQLIAAGNDDFQSIDHAEYLDTERFYAAIKGKAGTQGIVKAIDELLERIEGELVHRAAEVDRNAAVLTTLHTDHQLLFQDRDTLLALDEADLLDVIDQRTTAFREEQAAKATTSEAGQPAPTASIPAGDGTTGDGGPTIGEAPQVAYRVVIDLACDEQEAVDFARSIRAHLASAETVTDIRLSRVKEPDTP